MTISNITEKLKELENEEMTLTDNIRRTHELAEDEEVEVMLNWDEQRDFEYLYDRTDLFAALSGILKDDNADNATRLQMLDVLLSDAKEVIGEREADIAKANTVIEDMTLLIKACEKARETIS